jgi:hypothetical protein
MHFKKKKKNSKINHLSLKDEQTDSQSLPQVTNQRLNLDIKSYQKKKEGNS